MSHLGRVIGITDFKVERVDRGKDIDVYAKPTKRPACLHCQSTRIVIKATN